MIIDIYTHILPPKLLDRMTARAPHLAAMVDGFRNVRPLYDLNARFRAMDEFGDYAQIFALPNPPLEDLTTPEIGAELSRIANDAMAELVAHHPDRFPAFAAAIPMHDVDAAMVELHRAVTDLGAGGIQIYTNVAGKPLDNPEFAPVFAAMAEFDLPIWLHPARPAGFADYATENRSRYQLWWCFGWPYETSVAMARFVFSGLFDRHPGLKIITHHLGGMIPYFEARIEHGYAGWAYASEIDNPLTCYDNPWAFAAMTPAEAGAGAIAALERPLMDYFRMFHADTALNGGLSGTKCGLDFFGLDHVVFSSDAPFVSTAGTIEVIEALELDDALRHRLYCVNAERLLKRSLS